MMGNDNAPSFITKAEKLLQLGQFLVKANKTRSKNRVSGSIKTNKSNGRILFICRASVSFPDKKTSTPQALNRSLPPCFAVTYSVSFNMSAANTVISN